MSKFSQLLSNPIFLSAFFGWFLAQFLKAVISMIKRLMTGDSGGSVLSTLLWSTGGMPSSHSSLVAAIATSVGVVEGLDSTSFFIALFYALIIVRDALGVRRSAGIQAKVLNSLGRDLNERFEIKVPKVKEINGHSPPEVTVGIILGFFTALAFCLL